MNVDDIKKQLLPLLSSLFGDDGVDLGENRTLKAKDPLVLELHPAPVITKHLLGLLPVSVTLRRIVVSRRVLKLELDGWDDQIIELS